MLEINKELVLSTAHVTESTCNNAIQQLIDDCILCGFPTDAGWRILVPANQEMNTHLKDEMFPRSLYTCLLIAATNDCKWLVLDQDCEKVSCIPSFEW